MKIAAYLSTLLVVLFISSCDETKKVLDVAGDVQLSGTYTVMQLNNAAANTGKTTEQTLSFAALDRSIRGNTGCNTFFGKYTTDLYTITIGDLAVTEKGCSPPIMTSERDFLNALNNTGSYSLQDGIVTLMSKSDRSVLLTAKKQKTE